MHLPRTLVTMLSLLLMALAPTSAAMAASMCATMAQPGETMAMPMPDQDIDPDKKQAGECAFLCAPLCQAVPCTTGLPGIEDGAPSASFVAPLPFQLLSATGPEPPPPRMIR